MALGAWHQRPNDETDLEQHVGSVATGLAFALLSRVLVFCSPKRKPKGTPAFVGSLTERTPSRNAGLHRATRPVELSTRNSSGVGHGRCVVGNPIPETEFLTFPECRKQSHPCLPFPQFHIPKQKLDPQGKDLHHGMLPFLAPESAGSKLITTNNIGM